ncbi:MAG: GNAT family N-acetyltransferase [Proteobacteria bacterium]|nr:GNAT family N-acetyltransferase [Pseudomonadota bacterium]
MTDLFIRPLTRGDVDDVIAIQAAIIRRQPGQNWVMMLQDHTHHDYALSFVAQKDGQTVGFLVGEVKIGPFGQEHCGWLEMVGVSPKIMGQGVGQALAERFFEDLAQRGIGDVFTSVQWHSGDMLAFFKALGFDRSNYINLQKQIR